MTNIFITNFAKLLRVALVIANEIDENGDENHYNYILC